MQHLLDVNLQGYCDSRIKELRALQRSVEEIRKVRHGRQAVSALVSQCLVASESVLPLEHG